MALRPFDWVESRGQYILHVFFNWPFFVGWFKELVDILLAGAAMTIVKESSKEIIVFLLLASLLACLFFLNNRKIMILPGNTRLPLEMKFANWRKQSSLVINMKMWKKPFNLSISRS